MVFVQHLQECVVVSCCMQHLVVKFSLTNPAFGFISNQFY